MPVIQQWRSGIERHDEWELPHQYFNDISCVDHDEISDNLHSLPRFPMVCLL